MAQARERGGLSADKQTGDVPAEAPASLRSAHLRQSAVAMANKAARIAWVIMTRGEVYRAHRPVTEGAA